MKLYLLLKQSGNNFKNIGVFRGKSIADLKKRLQVDVDRGKRPQGSYVFLTELSLRNQSFYKKTKKRKK